MKFLISTKDTTDGFCVEYEEVGNNNNINILYKDRNYANVISYYKNTVQGIKNYSKHFKYLSQMTEPGLIKHQQLKINHTSMFEATDEEVFKYSEGL